VRTVCFPRIYNRGTWKLDYSLPRDVLQWNRENKNKKRLKSRNVRRASSSKTDGASSENTNLNGLTSFILPNVSNSLTSWRKYATRRGYLGSVRGALTTAGGGTNERGVDTWILGSGSGSRYRRYLIGYANWKTVSTLFYVRGPRHEYQSPIYYSRTYQLYGMVRVGFTGGRRSFLSPNSHRDLNRSQLVTGVRSVREKNDRGFLIQLPPSLRSPFVRTSPITARPRFYTYGLRPRSGCRCADRVIEFAGGSQGWSARVPVSTKPWVEGETVSRGSRNDCEQKGRQSGESSSQVVLYVTNSVSVARAREWRGPHEAASTPPRNPNGE